MSHMTIFLLSNPLITLPSHTVTTSTNPVCTAMVPRQGHNPAPSVDQTLTVLSPDPLMRNCPLEATPKT